MALPNYKLTPHVRPADWVLYRRDRFLLDPPYQRGSVWDLARKQNLLRSLLIGIPIGALIINVRPNFGARFVVVDGKQRIEALCGMADGVFGIPAEWVPEQFQGPLQPIEFDGATVPGVVVDSDNHPFMGVLTNFAISTIESQVPTVEDEAMIFSLVNTAGVAQTDSDIEHAQAVARG